MLFRYVLVRRPKVFGRRPVFALSTIHPILILIMSFLYTFFPELH